MADIGRRTLIGAALTASMVSARPARAETDSPPAGLFKCTEFVRRARGSTPDAFLAHWLNKRAPLLLDLKGLRGLSFNRVIPDRSPDAAYDGVIEMRFADEAAYREAFGQADDKAIAALAEDWPRFATGDPMGLFTREHPVRVPATPPGIAKRIGLVGRNPAMSEQRFFHEWQTVHAPEAAEQPGLTGYVLNLRTGLRLPDLPWDGYAALWWADWPAFEAARQTIRAAVGARLGFFHAHHILYVEEHVARRPEGRFA